MKLKNLIYLNFGIVKKTVTELDFYLCFKKNLIKPIHSVNNIVESIVK